ncbi:MAG: flagellar export protein FliJ [Lachnospiraceae bacterium]|nr:flagellar export protein FliJ [Lachnospiraceae bacterium]
MAKFFYRMQNILDVKYKLEEQAKQEYMSVRVRLDEAMDVLHAFENRKDMYMDEYRNLVSQKLKVLEIEECKNAIILMDEYILEQNRLIDKIQNELDLATKKLNHAMQERKVHEKLKEKQFETFLQELNLEEMKEIDELVSYQYNEKEE